MGEIYRNYQQPDGFLHVGFRMESTFGWLMFDEGTT
jgi:hypothetical protein